MPAVSATTPRVDLNREYAAHQQALMLAGSADNRDDRLAHLVEADSIAVRISTFQKGLGAAAARAWSNTQFMAGQRI